MKIGKLRQYVTLQKPTRGKDANGQVTTVWTTGEVDMWADVRTLNGREYFGHEKVNADVTHNVTIRWYNDVKPEYRIKFDDGTNVRYLNIEFITEDYTHRKMLVLRCREDRDI